MNKILPGYRITYIIAGFTLIFMSFSLFIKGLIKSMAEFNVPKKVLLSPHYYDAIFWVYLHMLVIGVLIILLGYGVKERSKQTGITFILFLINCFYTFIDIRSSDSPLGNSLYKGEASIIPAVLSFIITLLFLQLFIRLFIKTIKLP